MLGLGSGENGASSDESALVAVWQWPPLKWLQLEQARENGFEGKSLGLKKTSLDCHRTSLSAKAQPAKGCSTVHKFHDHK